MISSVLSILAGMLSAADQKYPSQNSSNNERELVIEHVRGLEAGIF